MSLRTRPDDLAGVDAAARPAAARDAPMRLSAVLPVRRQPAGRHYPPLVVASGRGPASSAGARRGGGAGPAAPAPAEVRDMWTSARQRLTTALRPPAVPEEVDVP